MPTQLSIHNLSFKYRLTEPWIFHKVEFALTPGLYGLLGLNGQGKTTFIKCLAGIYQADSGKIRFIWHGKELRHHKFREKLGYVPQNFAFYDEMRAEQYLAYIADMKLIPRQLVPHRIDELLLQFGLSDVRESRINTLSVGQKKRLMLAQALLADPYFILLDEPLDGLDLEERNRLMALLHNLASYKIIIMASHVIAEVEQWIEQVLFIHRHHITPPRTAHYWKMKMHLKGDSYDHINERDTIYDLAAQGVTRDPTLEDVLLWLSGGRA